MFFRSYSMIARRAVRNTTCFTLLTTPSAVSFMRWAKRSTDGYENQSIPGLEPKT